MVEVLHVSADNRGRSIWVREGAREDIVRLFRDQLI